MANLWTISIFFLLWISLIEFIGFYSIAFRGGLERSPLLGSKKKKNNAKFQTKIIVYSAFMCDAAIFTAGPVIIVWCCATLCDVLNGFSLMRLNPVVFLLYGFVLHPFSNDWDIYLRTNAHATKSCHPLKLVSISFTIAFSIETTVCLSSHLLLLRVMRINVVKIKRKFHNSFQWQSTLCWWFCDAFMPISSYVCDFFFT